MASTRCILVHSFCQTSSFARIQGPFLIQTYNDGDFIHHTNLSFVCETVWHRKNCHHVQILYIIGTLSFDLALNILQTRGCKGESLMLCKLLCFLEVIYQYNNQLVSKTLLYIHMLLL